MPSAAKEFVNVKSACEVLGVCPNTLRSWGASGKIAEYRHPINNYRLYRKDDVQRLAKLIQNPVPINRKAR